MRHILTISCILLFTIVVLVAQESDSIDLEDGLILHLTFDDTFDDVSDNGNHAIPENDPQFTTDRFDTENSALLLDGDNDYLRIEYAESLDIEQALTISFWIYYEEQELPTWYTILEKTGDADGHARYGAWIINGLVEVCIESAENAPRIGPQTCFDSTVELKEDEWNHVAGTFDGEQITITTNNEDAGILNRDNTLISTNDYPMYIGTDQESTRPIYLRGALDDMRLYNRVLTEEEIERLYMDEPEN